MQELPPLFQFGHSVVFVLVSFILLYLWLIATGRTVLRWRSVEESAAAIPTRLLWSSGTAAIASAILLASGEAAIRHMAEGDVNALSRTVDGLVPVLLMLGVFNLVLAYRRHPRLLVLAAMLSNAATAWFCLIIAISNNLHMHRGYFTPFALFSLVKDFPVRWLQRMGPEDAFPLTSLANWNYLRVLSLYLPCLLAVACTFTLFSTLVAFSKKEEEDGAERKRSQPKSGRVRVTYLTAVALGVAAFLLGLAHIRPVSDFYPTLLFNVQGGSPMKS